MLLVTATHPLAPTLLSKPFSCWWWCKFVWCNCDCCCWICCCCEWCCWAEWLDDEINEWFRFWLNWLCPWFDCWWKLSEFSACWLSDAEDGLDDVARFCDWSEDSGWCDNDSPVNDIDGIRSIIFLIKNSVKSSKRWTNRFYFFADAIKK